MIVIVTIPLRRESVMQYSVRMIAMRIAEWYVRMYVLSRVYTIQAQIIKFNYVYFNLIWGANMMHHPI